MKNKKRKKKNKKVVAIALSSALVVSPAAQVIASTIDASKDQIISTQSTNKKDNILNDSSDSLPQNTAPDKNENPPPTEATSPNESTNSNNANKNEDENKLPQSENSSDNKNTPNIDETPTLQENPPSTYSTDSSNNEKSNAPFNTKVINGVVYVDIPDVNLRKALNEKLDKGAIDRDITPEEMTRLPEKLNLYNKGITNLSGINAAINLVELNLGGNPIKNLPNGTFYSLNKLTLIDLSHAELTEINNDAFINLPYITKLFFYNNKITSLPSNIFSNIPTLEWLHLNSNNISTISTSAFSALPNLVSLVLQSNYISEITAEHFANNPRIGTLYLSGNKLTSIPSNLFSNTPGIWDLRLSENNLTSIDENTFKNMTGLYTLYLDSNKISSIAPNTFSHTPNLKNLHLQNNNLSRLDRDTFSTNTKLELVNISNNKLSDVSSLSTKTSATVDATNQNVTLSSPLLDNKYNTFTLSTSLLSSIVGFGPSSLSSFNSSMLSPSDTTSNPSISPDGSSIKFQGNFPSSSTSSFYLSYTLPSKNPTKHSYSVKVDVPLRHDLSVINTLNSTLAKDIGDISPSDGYTLLSIQSEIQNLPESSKKYITDNCSNYSKINDYLNRVSIMKNILNYKSIIISNDKQSIKSLVDTSIELSANQCTSLKTPINEMLTLYLNLIKEDLNKFHIDTITIKDKVAIKELHTSLDAISSSIEKISSKGTSIVSYDVLNSLELYKKTLSPMFDKILELEIKETIETLTTLIGDVINVSPDNITLKDSSNLQSIYTLLYSQSTEIQEKVISSFPSFNEKMPKLFERSNLILSIQNYSYIDTTSSNDVLSLIDKCFMVSQSQKLQLAKEINSIFSIYIDILEKYINKFTLDAIKISDKDEINTLTNTINSIKFKIDDMNKAAGDSVVNPTTQGRVSANIGKLQSFSLKIQALEKEAIPLNEVLEKVESFITLSPSEISLNDALNIISTNKLYDALSRGNKSALLNKIPDFENKMSSLLERSNKLIAIKNYTSISENNRKELIELAKSSSTISLSQKLELQREIDSIFLTCANSIEKAISKYSVETIKINDKNTLLPIREDIKLLRSLLNEVNTSTASLFSNLLAESETLLSDATSSTRIVSLETENKITTLSRDINSLLLKIIELQKAQNQTSLNNQGGQGSQGTLTGSSSLNKDKLAQTGSPLSALILSLGSASLLGGSLLIFKRRKK